MDPLYEYDEIPENGKFKFSLEMDNIVHAIDIYKNIIKQIIEAMKMK